MDDGSGVISCHFGKKSTELDNIEELRLSLKNDSTIMVNTRILVLNIKPLMFRIFLFAQLISNQEDEGLETLLTLLEKEKGDYTIGDTLHVQGKLSFYKEEWKIFANTIRRYFKNLLNSQCLIVNHLRCC